MSADIEAVVFDIGGVLVDADYRYLYRQLIEDPDEIEWFLATVCTQDWHRRHDAGRPMRDGVAELVALFPDHAGLIRAWDERFEEVWAGPITDTVAIARELHAAGVPLYLLSNWPAEKFPQARQRFPFLDELFVGHVVSGYEGTLKPERAIFDLLRNRFGLTPAATVFVDDSAANVTAAAGFGYRAVQFHSPAVLRRQLVDFGLPLRPPTDEPTGEPTAG